MIVTIEKTNGPFIVTCGLSKTEHIFLEDALQQVALHANNDREITPSVDVIWQPAPVQNAFGPIESL